VSSPSKTFCESCGKSLNPDTRFCGYCGAAVAAVQPDNPVTAVAQPVPGSADVTPATAALPDLGGVMPASEMVPPLPKRSRAVVWTILTCAVLGIVGVVAYSIVKYGTGDLSKFAPQFSKKAENNQKATESSQSPPRPQKGELTRSYAAEVIQKSKDFQDPPITTQFSSGCVRSFPNADGRNRWFFASRSAEHILESSGYVVIADSHDPQGCAASGLVEGSRAFVISLTEKGQQKSREWKKEEGMSGDSTVPTEVHWTVPVATRELIEVTGIMTEGKMARVEYTWKCAPNDVGQNLAEELQGTGHGTADFQLYDDGWRLIGVHNASHQ